jgi:hypothetical protein
VRVKRIAERAFNGPLEMVLKSPELAFSWLKKRAEDG